MQALEGLGDAVVAGAEDFGVFLRGFQIPRPAILERLDLRVRLRAVLFGEEDVVVGIRVELGIEVDQVDGFVFDVPAKDVEVVAII